MRAVAVPVQQGVRLFGASECVEHLFTGKRCGKRHRAASEQLCIASHVWLDTEQLRCRDGSKPPQPGENFVYNKRHLLSLANCCHCALECGVDENHARSAVHHRLDDGRAHRAVSMVRSVRERSRHDRSIRLAQRTRVTLCTEQLGLGEAPRIGGRGASRARGTEAMRQHHTPAIWSQLDRRRVQEDSTRGIPGRLRRPVEHAGRLRIGCTERVAVI